MNLVICCLDSVLRKKPFKIQISADLVVSWWTPHTINTITHLHLLFPLLYFHSSCPILNCKENSHKPPRLSSSSSLLSPILLFIFSHCHLSVVILLSILSSSSFLSPSPASSASSFYPVLRSCFFSKVFSPSQQQIACFIFIFFCLSCFSFGITNKLCNRSHVIPTMNEAIFTHSYEET